ncbi:MAG: type restriction enzyme subunit [Thermococcaceae archaeon]|nr:type restriction enzyme subunit [Thermococcaceae archaeon]
MPKFKKTPIGEIPEDWNFIKLRDVAKIRGNKRVKEVTEVAVIPMELIPDSGIFADYRVVPIEQVKSSTYCEAGDILLAKITPSLENGKQGIVPFDIPNGFALATTEVFPIAPEEDKIDRFFLFYLLKFNKFRQKIIASMTGTTGRQRASKKAVENLLIPLPPLPEQKKIAEILRTVDEAIEKTDLAIERTERLKRGLMRELLTKGIGHREFKKTELGRIPKEWRVISIRQAGKVITGKTPPTSESRYWNGDIPFITPADIGDNPYVNSTQRFVSREGAEKVGKLLPKDTVLVVCIGSTIGKVALTARESVTNQQINAIICNDTVNPQYHYYVLLFHSKRLKSWSGTAAVPIIKKSLFEKFKIPLPPLDEQKKIAEILSTVDKKLELLRKREEKLERVKRGLMKDLLTGRRRVKV